jgi:hypothetical protein
MGRTAWAALLLAGAFTASPSTADDREVKVLARAAWSHLPTHTSAGIGTDRAIITRVIRTDAELAKAAGNGGRVTVPKAFGVPAIDFTKQMLVAVEDGTQPMVGVSGGGPPSAPYTVSVVRVDSDGKTLTVYWRRLRRKADQVLTRPEDAVLLPRSDAEVKFHKLPDPPAEPTPPPPVGKAVEHVVHAFWPDGWPPEAPRTEWVVRSENDLIDPRLRAPEPVLERMRAEARARYAKALGVRDIDFGTQMVAGVSGGVQPAGAKVEVTRVTADPAGKVLTIHWRLRPPAQSDPAGGIAHVAEVVLLDRFPGDVRFAPER